MLREMRGTLERVREGGFLDSEEAAAGLEGVGSAVWFQEVEYQDAACRAGAA